MQYIYTTCLIFFAALAGFAQHNGIIVLGRFSGEKEIEAGALDNEFSYVFGSDDGVGVRKYWADPDAGNNEELALFIQGDMKDNHEGITIYKSSDSTGYVCNHEQRHDVPRLRLAACTVVGPMLGNSGRDSPLIMTVNLDKTSSLVIMNTTPFSLAPSKS